MIEVVLDREVKVIEHKHKHKEKVFFKHFIKLISTEHAQTMDFNYRQQLQNTAQPITEEEISYVIDHWPNNKAPGPDGYTGEFYKKFKSLLMTYNSLISQPMKGLHSINDSYIALI